MGKVPGFWKKTGIALRKIFLDPFKKGMSKDYSFGKNALMLGKNVAGTLTDLSGLAKYAMSTLGLDKNIIGAPISAALGATNFISGIAATGLNKAASGEWGREYNLPVAESIQDSDWGDALTGAKRFVQEVNDEYEQRFGKGASSFNQKPYGQSYDKQSMHPGNREQLTRPGARRDLFNMQRPHWTSSQSKIDKFGQK